MDFALLNRPFHQDQVYQAIKNLRDKHKGHYLGIESDPLFPKEPQRVVAELNLGFWIALFSDPYTHAIVTHIAADVFPNGPKEITREARQDIIYPRLKEILDLRNRIFHHEPIYHWTFPGEKDSLWTRYERLREVIEWMDDCQPLFLAAIDRFEKVHNGGVQGILDEAEFTFLLMAQEKK